MLHFVQHHDNFVCLPRKRELILISIGPDRKCCRIKV